MYKYNKYNITKKHNHEDKKVKQKEHIQSEEISFMEKEAFDVGLEDG